MGGSGERDSEQIKFRVFVVVLATLLCLVTYYAGRDIGDLKRRIEVLEQQRK